MGSIQTAKKVILTLLVLISVGAGIPKIMQMPQELGFLAHIGLSAVGVTLVGVVQLAGGVLMLPVRTRLIGAILAVIGLLVSAIALLKGGNMVMGLVSFIPLAMGISVVVQCVLQKDGTRRQIG